jgi:hypothetical protein
MEIDPNCVESLCIINDIRSICEFKGMTFSKCNKSEVKKALLLSLSKGKIEPSCHWAAELICSGHFTELWETILFYMGKYIHLGNPKLIIYLELRYNMFKSILENGNFTTILQLRNNDMIRKLFAEIMCVLCQSKTQHSFEPIKINPKEDFDVSFMSDRLKAPSSVFLEEFFLPKDPKSYFIAVNEFSYCISSSKDMISACYWIEWVIEFEINSKKKNEYHGCERRPNLSIDHLYQKDAIWIIWDAIIYYSSEKDAFTQRLISSLKNLFCIKYTTSSCKKRKYLMYFAVGLLIENVDTTTEIQKDKNILQVVVSQINHVYKQIKKNEISPNMEYLFNGLDEENITEGTIKKLQMMDSITEGNFIRK